VRKKLKTLSETFKPREMRIEICGGKCICRRGIVIYDERSEEHSCAEYPLPRHTQQF
jgi:hypothetical protein